MRGRLIQKFVAVIRRLDTATTAAVVGGGMDPVFGDVLPRQDGSQFGSASRREHPAIRVPCQVDRRQWGMDTLYRSGHDESTTMVLTLFMQDIENAGLIDTNGAPVIRPGDRIEQIEDIAGNLQEKFPVETGGMYVTMVERAGHGLNMGGTPRFNLLFLTCSSEQQGGPT